MDELDDFIAHFGVKGMRWGVRRKPKQPTSVVVIDKPGKRLKAKGGKNREASEEAIRLEVGKQKGRKSGTKTLTNKELQEIIKRMELDTKFAKLSREERQNNKSAGRKFIESQAQALIREQIAKNGAKWAKEFMASPKYKQLLAKLNIKAI